MKRTVCGIGWIETKSSDVGDDFARLLAWAQARLSALEVTTHPHNLDENLKAKKLFSKTDDLADLQGDPVDGLSYL